MTNLLNYGTCLLILVACCYQVEAETNDSSSNGKGRVLSLFSVVTFKNAPCRSTTNFNGTCYTTSECTNKGGTSSGNCASGFGVCCVFTVSSASGGSVTQNSTYLQNPSYPAAYTGTSAISYTINKCSSDVCWLRLDFDSFTILGPTTSTELDGGSCADTFKVTVSTGQSIPTICGKNTGQHIYVDVGTGASDTATIAFAFSSTASTTRTWNIKVSQIPCTSQTAPPTGCLQYYYGISGRITTFNFLDTINGHLQNQQYGVCIRGEAGMCCTRYEVCGDQTRAFSLSDGQTASTAIPSALLDTICTYDYLEIAGSSTCSNMGSGTSLHSKYCGGVLSTDTSTQTLTGVNVPICDCSPPFQVGIVTDAISDAGTTIANVQVSRGICLDFTQIPCSN